MEIQRIFRQEGFSKKLIKTLRIFLRLQNLIKPLSLSLNLQNLIKPLGLSLNLQDLIKPLSLYQISKSKSVKAIMDNIHWTKASNLHHDISCNKSSCCTSDICEACDKENPHEFVFKHLSESLYCK